MQPVVAKFQTFREAKEAAREYYRRLALADRLETLFQLRALARREDAAASGSVYRIAELKWG